MYVFVCVSVCVFAGGAVHVNVDAGTVDVEPVSLIFKNVSYAVKLADGSTKELLKDVSGFAKPYTLTALMGASGALTQAAFEPITALFTARNRSVLQVRERPPCWTWCPDGRRAARREARFT